jgi:biotin carboxylase
MHETILILAAGPLQVPAIRAARLMGLRTVAVDANANAAGMVLADRVYTADILDANAVGEIASRENVRGILTLCTDAPVRTVAAVGTRLGLPVLTQEAAECATDKRRMRQAFAAHNAPSARFVQVTSLGDALLAAAQIDYPVALKIARSSGSRGVYRVTDEPELHKFWASAREYQPDGDLLVEEWLDGPEISVEGVCCRGAIFVVQVTDKSVFPGPFPVESGHTQPSQFLPLHRAEIEEAVTAGVRALGLDQCGFHAELKMTLKGPRIIEIGARLGGDRIATHLTPLSTGVDLVRAVIDIALGRRPDLQVQFDRGSAVRYLNAPPGHVIAAIGSLDEVRAMPGLELLFPESERDGPLGPGFKIPEIRSSLDRYGHVIFSGPTRQEASARAEAASRAMVSLFHFARPELVGTSLT